MEKTHRHLCALSVSAVSALKDRDSFARNSRTDVSKAEDRERSRTANAESGVGIRTVGLPPTFGPTIAPRGCSLVVVPSSVRRNWANCATLGRGLSAVHALLLLLTLIAILSPVTCAEGSKPNFVFILTDDQRYDALGCAGNAEIKTPHLDSLAELCFHLYVTSVAAAFRPDAKGVAKHSPGLRANCALPWVGGSS